MFKDDLIFDIGMHKGVDTEFYLKKGYKVVGFEANPYLVSHCKKKFEAEINQNRLIVVEGIFSSKNNQSNFKFQLFESGNEVQIPILDIVKYFTLHGVPQYIKITMGAEVTDYVLNAISQLVRKPKYISLAPVSHVSAELTKHTQFLTERGYSSLNVPRHDKNTKDISRFLDREGNVFTYEFPTEAIGAFGKDLRKQWMCFSDAQVQAQKINKRNIRLTPSRKQRAAKLNMPVILDAPIEYVMHFKMAELITENIPFVSLVLTCKNRLEHLKQSLLKISNQKSIEIIVVDYGCTEGTREWVKANYPEARVVCVDDDPIFSISRARNIGALHAGGEFIMFTDADILIDFPISVWVEENATNDEFYSVDPRSDASLCGTAIINKCDFYSVGGYDEAFRGWGGEDTELYARLKNQSIRQKYISNLGIKAIQHSDSIRQLSLEHGGVGSKKKALYINRLYTRVIGDLYNSKKTLVIQDRLDLREEIKKFVDDVETKKIDPIYKYSVAVDAKHITNITFNYKITM